MSDKFFNKVYQTHGAAANKALYDDWSESYEADVGEHGYATPGRIAKALADLHHARDTPILDYGCGTGLFGQALRAEGFTTIDGMDPSEGMLAKCPEGLYRRKILLDLEKPLPLDVGAYQIIMAVGVISTGAGPASLMDDLMTQLVPGGLFGLSLNDHALADPEYPDAIARLKAAGHIARVEDYGAHLPGLDVKSMIYLFEKA